MISKNLVCGQGSPDFLLVAFCLLHFSDVLSRPCIFFEISDPHSCSYYVCEGFFDALWHQLSSSTDIDASTLSQYKVAQHWTVLSDLVLDIHFASTGTLS